MKGHDVIVIGASAGGVEALSKLVGLLPADLPAAVLVVMHFPSYGTSVLPEILARSGRLPAKHAEDHEPIEPGCIYVARPDYHLLLYTDGNGPRVQLSRGPRQNSYRPSIDALFRSAARALGPRVVGVILSGTLDDGSAGLQQIKHYSGVTVVQDPQEAMFSDMPAHAIERTQVDYVLPIADLAAQLVRLVGEPAASESAATESAAVESTASKPAASEPIADQVINRGMQMQVTPDPNGSDPDREEDAIVQHDKQALEQAGRANEPSMLTCPACGGVLWELREGQLVRYRCHVGHSYSTHSLLSDQSNSLEVALWAAVRALEERAALARRLQSHSQENERRKSAFRFEQLASEAERGAELIRQVILTGQFNLASEVADKAGQERHNHH